MNWRSLGTSTWGANDCLILSRLCRRCSGKTSAMATSLVGPFLAASPLAAAPVPRPPQPTNASCTVSLLPACTYGMVIPAKAEATATWPDFLMSSRRDRPLLLMLLTVVLLLFLWWVPEGR